MSGSSPSEPISPCEPVAQISAEDSPFAAVILSDSDNERYYDAAYDSAKAQSLPFRSIHSGKLTARLAAEWRRVLQRVEAAWVIYLHADIELTPSATLKVYPFLAGPGIGSLRVGASNELLGDKFVKSLGSPDIGVCRTSALRAVIDPATSIFDPNVPLALRGYQIALLRSRTRSDSSIPGTISKESSEVITLGRNIADWSPAYAYRWCRIFGAHARACGGAKYGELVASMVDGGHPQWQLGLAGIIAGAVSGDGPDIRDRIGDVRREFEQARFLAKED